MEQATLNAADLLTIAGASLAAIIITQFLKVLLNLPALWIRVISMLTGLIVVVGTTVLVNEETNALQLFLALIVGMQAGMAAFATFDLSKSGFNYTTQSRESLTPAPEPAPRPGE